MYGKVSFFVDGTPEHQGPKGSGAEAVSRLKRKIVVRGVRVRNAGTSEEQYP